VVADIKNIEKVIAQVNGTMAIEGMPLSSADKERIRKCAGNDRLVEKTVSELVQKHIVGNSYEQRL